MLRPQAREYITENQRTTPVKVNVYNTEFLSFKLEYSYKDVLYNNHWQVGKLLETSC